MSIWDKLKEFEEKFPDKPELTEEEKKRRRDLAREKMRKKAIGTGLAGKARKTLSDREKQLQRQINKALGRK